MGRSKGRVKKRKFQGNKFVRPCLKEDEDEEVSIIEDVNVEEIGQVKKIKLDGKLRKEFKGESHYMLMNSLILEKICSVIGKCPLCNISVKFTNELESKQGSSYTLAFSCTKCEWKQQFLTSPPAEKAQATSGELPLDINLRMVYAF